MFFTVDNTPDAIIMGTDHVLLRRRDIDSVNNLSIGGVKSAGFSGAYLLTSQSRQAV